MKLFRSAVLFLFIVVTVFGGGTLALAAELWATDPGTGTKIGIIFKSEDVTLVSVRWSGPAAGGLAEGPGKLEYIYKGKDGKEIKAQADAEMKAGKLQGKASIKWSDGDSYDGYYQDGWRSGQGVYKFANGDTYDGEWKNSMREGKGVMKFASGDTYDGEWKNDKREGKGVDKKSDGSSYDGVWKNDMPTGYGTIKWSNGETYQGDCKNGVRDGQGTYRWVNGNVYQGDFKNGNMDGQGTFRWVDGTVYQGDFKNDNMDGQGTFRWVDGRVYRGDFKNGIRDGQGLMTDAAGKVIHEGLWKEGKPVGGTGAGNTPGSGGSSGPAKAEQVLGIPWGASEDEARRIMKARPGTKYAHTAQHPRQTQQLYVGPFNGDGAVIHVNFYQGKMFNVDIIHYRSEDQLLGKFSELKDGMTQRYGAPIKESGKYLDATALWDLGPNYLAALLIRKSNYDTPGRPFMVVLEYWQEDINRLVNSKAGSGPGSGKDF